jgi:hypothetical protein
MSNKPKLVKGPNEQISLQQFAGLSAVLKKIRFSSRAAGLRPASGTLAGLPASSL